MNTAPTRRRQCLPRTLSPCSGSIHRLVLRFRHMATFVLYVISTWHKQGSVKTSIKTGVSCLKTFVLSPVSHSSLPKFPLAQRYVCACLLPFGLSLVQRRVKADSSVSHLQHHCHGRCTQLHRLLHPEFRHQRDWSQGIVLYASPPATYVVSLKYDSAETILNICKSSVGCVTVS